MRSRGIQKHLRGISAAALGCALLLWTVAPALADAGSELTCKRVPDLLSAYLQKHISFHYLNDEIRERAVESYLKRLDPSKTLLLEEEATRLRDRLFGVFHEVRGGNCAALEELQQEMLGRYVQMKDSVEQIVTAEDYALDPDVMLVIDPKKRARPKTEQDRRNLYSKLVHFQMSTYVSGGMTLEEAKGKLVHRYELMVKRAKELEVQDIYAIFLDSFASSLDPHSNYLSPDYLEDFQIQMQLSLEGIGVALSSRDGYSVVEKIIPGGAADGIDVLQPNDKIIAVAQEKGDFVDVIDMDLRDVVRLIRGKRGTKVHLRVLRQSDTTETLSVTIVRDHISLEEAAAKLRFESLETGGETRKLAILELPSFYGDRNPTRRQSSRDLRELLARVKQEKADGLLLDLSRNGGGLLENSVEIAGLFIREGAVVAVKDHFEKVQVLRDPDDSIQYDGPLVVLMSRVSASASEIVAGAMRDYQRAVLVGDDHTFGKGTVQSMVPLPNGLGALKVTTALFFRPGGASTQHSGVEAHIELPSLFSTDEFGEKYQPYSLPSQEITPFADAPENGHEERLWPAITPDLLAELSRRSALRVSESEEFADVQRKLDESRSRKGVVHIAELLENSSEDAKAKEVEPREDSKGAGDADIGPTASASDDEVTQSPQQREALRILADYVAISG